MTDTSIEAAAKQREIIFSKTMGERILMGIEMIEFSIKVIENSLKARNPLITKSELAVERFRIFYKNDFDQEELQRIEKSLYDFNLK